MSSSPTCRKKASPTRTCAAGAGAKARAPAAAPESAISRARKLLARKKWLPPLLTILVLVSAYLAHPTPSNPIHHALFVSYPQQETQSQTTSTSTDGGGGGGGGGDDDGDGRRLYGKGKLDFVFVGFYTILFTFTREFLMQECLRPLAIRFNLRNKGKMVRFSEQVYTALYFSVFGPFGLYVMKNSAMWYFETRPMYEGYPHKILTADFKVYYLLQAAYWTQQALVLVLGLEKPRKDFHQLILHHVVTVALIFLSYRFHFTNIGLPVYITHDISDWFLATSKVMNYIDCAIVGPFLFVFMCVWAYMRHYLNLRILWSLLTEFRTVDGFYLDWETQHYKCWISQYITFGLLAVLQSVNCYWFFLILRIAKNYVFAGVKKDERSADEDSEPETELERALDIDGSRSNRIKGEIDDDDDDDDSDKEDTNEHNDADDSSRPRRSYNAAASAVLDQVPGLRERTNRAPGSGDDHDNASQDQSAHDTPN